MADNKSVEISLMDTPPSRRQASYDMNGGMAANEKGMGRLEISEGNSQPDVNRKTKLSRFLTKYSFEVKVVVISVFLLSYSIAGISMTSLENTLSLFIIAMVMWCLVFYMFMRNQCGAQVYTICCLPIVNLVKRKWNVLRWLCLVVGLTLIGLWLGFDTSKKPRKLISLVGMFIFVGFSYLCSTNRKKVRWRPVLWGLTLQFIFALIILRTSHGYEAFRFIGDQVTGFLEFTNVGSEFVFGKDYTKHLLAMKILPVIIFFSSVISVLYYLGLMQLVIAKLAWLMQITMGTSAAESLTAAGNIFVGQTESPLLIRPFLEHLTNSELHAVMTCGLATVAGGMLAIYISFGVQASHLISASVMSAPAALAVSKLFYPETDVPETSAEETLHVEAGGEKNVIEAAAKGASTAISLVANVCAMLIAFFSYLAFFNAILSWLGGMVGYPELSFETICSYLFMPLAFIMGVEWQDCGPVAKFLGIKVFLNELVGYIQMSPYIQDRTIDDGKPRISVQSEIIATYALCGFSNFLGLGVLLGGLGPMAPNRKRDMARIAIRTLVAANIACFMTASIAGFLYDSSNDDIPFSSGNSTFTNSTLTNSTSLNTTMAP